LHKNKQFFSLLNKTYRSENSENKTSEVNLPITALPVFFKRVHLLKIILWLK